MAKMTEQPKSKHTRILSIYVEDELVNMVAIVGDKTTPNDVWNRQAEVWVAFWFTSEEGADYKRDELKFEFADDAIILANETEQCKD